MEDDNKYKKLTRDAKQYFRTRYDLLRLEMLEKMSQILSLILFIVVVLVLVLAAFIYFSFALVFWLESFFNSMIPPFLIVGAAFVVLIILVAVLKDKIFLQPVIKQLSAIIFKPADPSEDDIDQEIETDHSNAEESL